MLQTIEGYASFKQAQTTIAVDRTFKKQSDS